MGLVRRGVNAGAKAGVGRTLALAGAALETALALWAGAAAPTAAGAGWADLALALRPAWALAGAANAPPQWLQ